MASPSAILAAAKAARSVTSREGSPAAASGTWAGVYSNPLPRPASDFTDGAFTPLTPIPPFPIDVPPPGTARPMPRRRQYFVGENLPTGQPRTEGYTLTDFGTLRALAGTYSVARACIQLLKSEIRALEWDIVPTKDAAKAMRGDHEKMRDFGERRAKVIRFFKNPDPEYGSWSSWIDTALEDVYAIDALSCYLRPSRVRGRGLLGSDLSALELIDGSTFRPLVDVHGGRPSPPSPSLQQYIFGVPRTDNMSIMLGSDLPEGMSEAKVRDYRGDQLLYLPYTRRTSSPYGSPPIEQALVPVMSGLYKQQLQMEYFTSGSVPQVYISPGDAALNASQIADLQVALNVIAGDVGMKRQVVVLPPGSKPYPMKDPQLADQFDQVVAVEVCMAFNVQPTELGIMPQVATVQTPSAMNMASKAQSAIHQRKSLVPMLQFLKQGLLDKVIQIACGQADMQFMFEGLEEDEDEQTLTNLLIAQVGGGLASVDEARAELGRDPWGLPVTSDPLWASANGVMLLGSVDPVTGQPAGQPAALPSVGQQMSGAVGGSARPSPGGNEGQVNPAGALAQGHMPGTTHVPPARQRDITPSHSAAIAGAAEASARTATSSAKAVGMNGHDVLHKYEAVVPGDPSACLRCGSPRHYPVHAILAISARKMLSGSAAPPPDPVIAELLTARDAASLSKAAAEALGRDDTEAFQDRGEPVRTAQGIDGTAGDTQDIPHRFTPDRGHDPRVCVACGFPRTFTAHKSAAESCGCCGGAGEHATGHECYRCDASSHPEGSERAAPFCDEVFRDVALHSKGCPNCGRPPFLGSGSAKAVLSEMDALARHVRKGRDPATWTPVHIPVHVMASITADLSRGLDAAEVITAAAADLGKASGPSWAAWERDEVLAGKYAALIEAAFGQVQSQAADLFGQWLAGSLPVTPQVLASMVADLIRERLALILASLRSQGYALGVSSARIAAGITAEAGEELAAMAQVNASLAQQAAIRQMSATGMAGLAGALAAAILGGGATVGSLLAILAALLTPARARLIAVTELQRAIRDGESAAYAEAGVTYLRWITRNDGAVCKRCKLNQDAGPWPAGRLWPSGAKSPADQHPGCRCRTVPSDPPPGTLGKSGSTPPGGNDAGRGSVAPGLPRRDPAVTKAGKAWKRPDTSSSAADQAYTQMLDDYPAKAIAWMKDATWKGPLEVPLDDIEYQPSRWQAGHEPAKVERFRRKIERRQNDGRPVKPVILIDAPDTERGGHYVVIDGHHRTMAFKKLGRPVIAYVGTVDAAGATAARETHSSQKPDHDAGTDPYAESPEKRKSWTAGGGAGGSVHGLVPFDLAGQVKAPAAAGIAVRAADTGRVLMLQRAVSDDDPAGGHWEFPGGCLDDGEDPLDAARREWQEECGMPLPGGEPGGAWVSRNGAYHGFVLTVPSEFPVHEGRDQVTNPDDPDGDQVEAIAWWDVSQLPGNPAVRRELAGDLDLVMSALARTGAEMGLAKSARTPYVSAVHNPLGHEGLWHTPDRHVATMQQLPAYIQNTARALMAEHGLEESHAIAEAVNAVKDWAQGHAFGGKVKVTPEVQAAASRAVAEWERLRESHH